MLFILGFVLEMVVTMLLTNTMGAMAMTSVSFFIVFVAVARWNLWGLVLCPLLSFAPLIGSQWGQLEVCKIFYSFQYTGGVVYIASTVSLLALGLNVIVFKKFKTITITSSATKLLAMITVDYLVVCGVQLLVSFFLNNSGAITYMYTMQNGNEINLTVYTQRSIIYNLFGYFACLVGCLVFRSQGVINNVVDKLIDDRNNRELDKRDAHFRIKEINAESKEEVVDSSVEDPKGSSNEEESQKS